jgi:hypothetical protein
MAMPWQLIVGVLIGTIFGYERHRGGLGARNMGSIQEAVLWEQGGFPSQTSMNPKHYRR